MTTSRRSLPQSSRDLAVVTVAVAVAVAALLAWLGASPVGAADGAQPAPTVAPSPVPTAATQFSLSNGTCDGTGGGGWRVQTFIVNAGVNVGSLPFDQGGAFDRVGTDRDNSNGTIASPLFKGIAPGTGYNPAASPAGLIDPGNLTAFDFSDAGWVLTDGSYQIGYACIDQAGAVRQWWAVVVTIDVDASPNSFLTVGTGGATTTSTTSSTTSTTTGATTSTTAGGTTTSTTGGSTTSTTTGGSTTSTTQPGAPALTPSTVAPGGTVAITSSGWQAGSEVLVILHSAPTTLATLVATSTGALSGSVTIPAATVVGAHEIELSGKSTSGAARSARSPLTVATQSATTSTTVAGATTSTTRSTSTTNSSSIPRTGRELVAIAGIGFVLVLLGRTIYLFGRPGESGRRR